MHDEALCAFFDSIDGYLRCIDADVFDVVGTDAVAEIELALLIRDECRHTDIEPLEKHPRLRGQAHSVVVAEFMLRRVSERHALRCLVLDFFHVEHFRIVWVRHSIRIVVDTHHHFLHRLRRDGDVGKPHARFCQIGKSERIWDIQQDFYMT